MLPQLGQRLEKIPRRLQFVRDLEAFEGPILSEYRAMYGGAVYVEKWCARADGVSRFIIVRSEERAIAEFLGGRLSMLKLLVERSDGFGFLVDQRGEETVGVSLAPLDVLPKSYLPKSTRFHDEALRPEWEVVPQSYLIDGNWDAKLFSDIERINTNAAAFAYFTQPNASRSIPAGLMHMRYDGGFPIMHVYNGIRASLPSEVRPKAAAVAVASPGVFTIETPLSTAAMVRRAMDGLGKSQVARDAVHQWSRLRPDAVDNVPPVARETINRLCSILGVRVEAILQPAADAEEKMSLLVAGKLIVSYWKMLWRVLEPSHRAEYLGPKINKENPDTSSYEDDEDLGEDDDI